MIDPADEDDVNIGDDLGAWASVFRAAAKADDYAIFRDHLRRLELPDEPLLLLEGTISFVVMWASFFSLNRNESFSRLLKMQTYDPTHAAEAIYAVTFNIHVQEMRVTGKDHQQEN